MGQGRNGTGEQWDRDAVRQGNNGTGAQRDRGTMGQGRKGTGNFRTGTQWDGGTMGQGHRGTAPKRVGTSWFERGNGGWGMYLNMSVAGAIVSIGHSKFHDTIKVTGLVFYCGLSVYRSLLSQVWIKDKNSEDDNNYGGLLASKAHNCTCNYHCMISKYHNIFNSCYCINVMMCLCCWFSRARLHVVVMLRFASFDIN